MLKLSVSGSNICLVFMHHKNKMRIIKLRFSTKFQRKSEYIYRPAKADQEKSASRFDAHNRTKCQHAPTRACTNCSKVLPVSGQMAASNQLDSLQASGMIHREVALHSSSKH